MESSSPLHASILESSKIQYRNSDNPDRSSPFPASGAGSPITGASPRAARSSSNGRKRRLQLRNAGFRGPTVPGRRVTPANTSSTATTTTSDAENVSPLGRKKIYEDDHKESVGAGVLQDIGGNSAEPPRRVRQKMDRSDMRLDLHDNNTNHATVRRLRPQSLSSRAGIRRNRSREYQDHIDYLESQLDLAMESDDTAAKQHAQRARELGIENAHLQAAVRDWESNHERRITYETEQFHQREVALQARNRALEQQLAHPTEQQFARLKTQLRITEEKLASSEARNAQLEGLAEKTHMLLAASKSPDKTDQYAESPGGLRRGRPTSIVGRVPTAGQLALSPDRATVSQASSPYSPRYSRGGLPSPLGATFSPDVVSPDDSAAGSDQSVTTTLIHAPPDTVSRRKRYGRRFVGAEPKPLLLADTSNRDEAPLRSAPPLTSQDGEPMFRFPPVSPTVGSSYATHRRSSTESKAIRAARLPSNLTIDTTRSKIEYDAPSPTCSSLMGDDDDMRKLSSGTMSSTLGRSLGRNLMDELRTARTTSTSTGNEQWPSEIGHNEIVSTHDSIDTVIQSSPFDEEVMELPDAHENNQGAHAHEALTGIGHHLSTVTPASQSPAATSPLSVPASALVAPPTPWFAERRYQSAIIRRVIANSTNGTSLNAVSQSSLSTVGVASNASVSTLDSLRTALSNLFRSPIDVVKHLVQTAQERLSIPRPLLSIQWWLVGMLFGPMARSRMLGRSSPSGSSEEEQSLIEDSASDNDADALGYGTAYQTPQGSPSTAATGTLSMVAGTGKKRSALSGVDGGDSAKRCIRQPQHWKHSPKLWLKFSMCLAVAVGLAFRDGPSSLLKQAVCQCQNCKSKSNWRRANRDEPFTPSS